MLNYLRVNAVALALLSTLGATPTAHGNPIQMTAGAEDLAAGYARLTVGMPISDVLAAMKKEPSYRESTTYIGLEIVRLAWRQIEWGVGISYSVQFVAGRLASWKVEKTVDRLITSNQPY